MAVRSASDYYAQLVALLPPGPAWEVERVPAIRDLLSKAAEELAREDQRLNDLYNEMFPDTVRELVPDWERVMDLPDPCLGDNPAFEDRQLAVRRRLVEVGGQSRAFFIDLAISQGYPGAPRRITHSKAPLGFAPKRSPQKLTPKRRPNLRRGPVLSVHMNCADQVPK